MARAAQSQANQAQQTAGAQASQLFGEGQSIQSNLVPQLTAETTAAHSMSPDQLNELLTAAGAGTGGALGAYQGQAELEQARTGQGGPQFSAALDQMQRQRGQQLAKGAEGIAAEDVQGALANKQTAFKELGALSGQNTDAALKAMGIQTEDIGQEIQAGKSGWFQNLTGLMGSLGGAKQGPLSYV